MTFAPSRALRGALACSAGVLVVTFSWSCGLAPPIRGDRWWIPGDLWVFVAPARAIAAGALPFLYEAHDAYVYPPGPAIVLAPLVAAGDALLLGDRVVVGVREPTLWLLLAPALAAAAILPLAAGGSMIVQQDGRRPLAWQAVVTALALLPVLLTWGHFEEVLVAGLLLAAARASVQERWDASAVLLAGALLMKQTAFLALPLLLMAAPAGRRLRLLAIALAPVAVLCAICVVANPEDAVRALTSARSFPGTGRRALWVSDTAAVITAGPVRAAGALAGAFIGVAVRRHRSGGALIGALAVAMSVRLLFEPVVFPYYLGVPIVLATLAGWLEGRPAVPVAAGGAAMAFFLLPGDGPLWWAGFLACLGLMVLGPARTALVTGPGTAASPAPR